MVFLVQKIKKSRSYKSYGKYFCKSDDVYESARNVLKEIKLKENADFIIVDMHGEITSEKKAMGHF